MNNLSFIENLYRRFINPNAGNSVIWPMIYSGENSTFAFILPSDENNKGYVIKIAKNQCNAFFDRENTVYDYLTSTKLMDFINPCLIQGNYCGVKFSVSRYISNNMSHSRSFQKEINKNIIRYFELLHETSPPRHIDENIYYEGIIDFVFDIMKMKNEIAALEAKQSCMKYFHHGDMTLQNILWDPEADALKVIDWEYASAGWPFNDIWHFYLFSNNVFHPSKFSSKSKIVAEIRKIIKQLNKAHFNDYQLAFFDSCSLYSYFMKIKCDIETVKQLVTSYANCLQIVN